MSFDLASSYLLHSNLGGQGPDAGAPQEIRFVNVGAFYLPDGSSKHFDLVVTNRSSYTPHNASLNTLSAGRFAQINLASNHEVSLRVTMVHSCASAQSCVACFDASLSESERISCFAAGCACYGTTVFSEVSCLGASAAAKQASYGCGQMSTTLVLPREAMVTCTVYDFDTGPTGEYREQLRIPGYEYFVTPLRASVGVSSSTPLTSTIFVNAGAHLFTATARGDSSDNPTDPKALTADQASRGIQFFFRPDNGYIDATFSVSYLGSGAGEGRNLLFAGDSALCEPPPPSPPLMPPPSPPPPFHPPPRPPPTPSAPSPPFPMPPPPHASPS